MKILTGIVVTTHMQNTAIVRVGRQVIHPLYKKLLKRSKKYKVDTSGTVVNVGDTVTIIETRPISKYKYFKIQTLIKEKKK